jgi:hypothetical protein
METQRNPNELIKRTATGQEGGQQGGGSQERERELQPCKIKVTKLAAN